MLTASMQTRKEIKHKDKEMAVIKIISTEKHMEKGRMRHLKVKINKTETKKVWHHYNTYW